MALGAVQPRVLPSLSWGGRPSCAGTLRHKPAVGRRGRVLTRASADFNLSQYSEAVIQQVKSNDKYGHIVMLRLKDTDRMLPLYIGEYECGSLVKEINNKPTLRPLTHDLMKNSLEALGYRVTKVRITALVGNTYHARVHYARTVPRLGGLGAAASGDDGAAEVQGEVDVDARPSDAVNLAVRFGAVIYVNKEVAAKMAQPAESLEDEPRPGSSEHHSEVVRSCREQIQAYQDPTIMHKLQMQLAILDERFEDASALRDEIDKILGSDRALSLVVAMETALEDGRYEEAARLRDEFKALRQAQRLSSEISEI